MSDKAYIKLKMATSDYSPSCQNVKLRYLKYELLKR